MKKASFILGLVFVFSTITYNSYADRFPGGDPGDQCRAGGYDDCSVGSNCQMVRCEEDRDYPGRCFPVYDCVPNSEAAAFPNLFLRKKL